MNGYFNNLALRSMNTGNLVEPRLPSLFEPQRSEFDAAATPVYSEPRRESIDTPPTASPSAQLTVSVEESAVVQAVTEQQPSAPIVRTTPEDPTTPISFDEPPGVVTETLSTTETAPQTAQIKTQIAPKSTPKSVRKSVPKSVESVANHPDKPRPSAAITTSEVEEHVSIVEEQEAQDVYLEPPPATLKTQTLSKPDVKPQVVERVTERSRNTDKTDFRSTTRSITNYAAWRESDPIDPEPTINVTIGRVEVRATPAPTTKPARTKQESPVMPLEEYLRKQRRGGER